MKLSILVCTVTTRVNNFLPEIISRLSFLVQGKPVQILYLGDNKSMTVGEKRNDLIRISKGEYITFVDDDDKVTEDYISLILEGINSGNDVIVFKAYRHQDGRKDREVIYSNKYEKDSDTGQTYKRLPNHLMCWKRELALQVPFENINYGEDASWARAMKPLIKSEHRINKVLYHYHFNSATTETQKF